MKNSKSFKLFHESIADNYFSPITDNKILDFIQMRDLDTTTFFEMNNNFYPYCYFNENNGVYIEIQQFSEQFFNVLQIEKRITFCNEYMDQHVEENDYLGAFCFMEKKVRFMFFNKWYNDIPKKDLLEVFKFVYSSSEYNFNLLDINTLKEIKELSKEELSSFGDILEVYRGETTYSRHYKDAYSWTLSKETAKFFADRFDSNGTVLKAKVNKKDIVAYITDRQEEELVVFPNCVYDVKLL